MKTHRHGAKTPLCIQARRTTLTTDSPRKEEKFINVANVKDKIWPTLAR